MDSTYAQQVLATEQARIQDYMSVFPITFLYWDYLLTLSDEVQYFWKLPVGTSTVLFFLNRYVSLLGNFVVTISLFYNFSTESSCQVFHTFRGFLLIVEEMVVGVLLTVRIYALYDRGKRILAAMLSVGCILVMIALFTTLFHRSESSDKILPGVDIGCHVAISFALSVQQAAAWEALLLYNVMLFVMMLLKAHKTHHELRPLRIPLVDIIVRDGSLYFGVMAIANAINISTFYYPWPFIRASLTTFASSMSVTMMSRLMFNLHKVADSGLYASHRTTIGTHSTWPEFRVEDEQLNYDE
ncbi:hypothetical protein GYMLUDRAFT_47147 [Collybiopsis luxurians FD-317 M1]|uniref:DUF6533 domain-containing protein n=1 Tax=Collybiopsis luxurians FD-317 M1 TaxID=944289 RepID=A0A0D0CE79_9AGAR|nr:hypothetical protein GYMLUDRAFT_47147 [Collybiopsis luxurians FD-317 M1]